MSVVFQAVRYGTHQYPPGIDVLLDEVPAHFDVQGPRTARPYSMHTEYAAGTRRFSSPLLDGLDALRKGERRGIPNLWTSDEWAVQFAEFAMRFAATGLPPSVVEVHPPFRSSCKDVSTFLGRFSIFAEIFQGSHPQTSIVLENRHGSRNGGQFLVSTVQNLLEAHDAVKALKIPLQFALDIPQLLAAEAKRSKLSAKLVEESLTALLPITDAIRTVHIWGRRRAPHIGTLDDLVDHDAHIKKVLLEGMRYLFRDGRPRFLIPEVNSGQVDFLAIVRDLLDAGFVFR